MASHRGLPGGQKAEERGEGEEGQKGCGKIASKHQENHEKAGQITLSRFFCPGTCQFGPLYAKDKDLFFFAIGHRSD
jgi:hypothetical protein